MAEMKLVPVRITPEMAHALESNFAVCTDPSEVHAANWQDAWSKALAASPQAPAREGVDEDWVRGLIGEAITMNADDIDENGEELRRISEAVLNAVRPYLAALTPREEAPAEGAGEAIRAACIAWHEGKGENPFNVLYHGAWCGSFPHQTGPERWTFTVPAMEKAIAAYLRARTSEPAREVRETIVTAIAFLNRDQGTNRLDDTISALMPKLVRADAILRGAV